MPAIQTTSIPAQAETRTLRGEMRAALQERLFRRLDADRSGGVTRQEFSAALQTLPGGGAARATDRIAALAMRLDGDGDGQVSRAELAAARRRPARGGEAPGVQGGGLLGLLMGHGQPAAAPRHAAARYAEAVTRG